MNNYTEQTYQKYVEARQRADMPYIESYDTWLTKNAELAELQAENEADTWENSEYNPANYPDFESLDNETKQQRIEQGNAEYWQHSEVLEKQISDLEHLLLNPDELEKDDLNNDGEPVEYWTTDD
ncbi:hypothetical protein M2R47_08840 [Moraxella sp. Tifton1]|uniref:hypothetical protein n=1 Tax=Moraxella oculi TaxID=2940516 RepID=UPI00201398FC|nr:hypothetical protein [Moraxella sp. Tifton1]MCL1624338.1 hypothetical protein [Moraxella sp. Tifton1]